MHDSITLEETPSTQRVRDFLSWYDDGLRSRQGFDFLDHPEATPWLTVTKYAVTESGRYDIDKTVSIFAGSRIAEQLEIAETRLEQDEVDENSMARWGPVQRQAIRTKLPVIVHTYAYGIDKDFMNFEVGVFPFSNSKGNVDEIVMVAQFFDS